MYLPKVELNPSQYNVNYIFYLTEESGKTVLNFEIGDYSSLPKAKDYYDTSLEWVETAKSKIKELAEKLK